jgi:hypothetical protein
MGSEINDELANQIIGVLLVWYMIVKLASIAICCSSYYYFSGSDVVTDTCMSKF